MRAQAKLRRYRRLFSTLPFRLASPLLLAWLLSAVLGPAAPADPAVGEGQVGIADARRAFYAEAGSTVRISISSGTDESPCNATIHLYGPDGRLFTREEDFLYRALPYTGRYTVRVEGCTYDLTIRVSPPPQADQYELDDSALSARLLTTDGEPQLHSLHVPLDQDWVTFYVQEEQLLTLETYRLRNGCDTILTLYDVDLNPVAESDDYAGEERSFIRVLLTQPGQYFARVRHRGNRGAEGKAYLLRARLTTPVYGGKLRAPRQVTFPTARLGASRERVVQLTNLSNTEIVRLSLQGANGPFATDFPAGETLLLPRRSLRFKVQFTAASRGYTRGQLVLTTTDPTKPTLTLPLSGRGI